MKHYALLIFDSYTVGVEEFLVPLDDPFAETLLQAVHQDDQRAVALVELAVADEAPQSWINSVAGATRADVGRLREFKSTYDKTPVPDEIHIQHILVLIGT